MARPPAGRPLEPSVVEALRLLDEGFPHPRYPLLSSCASDWVSVYAAAATPVEGSLFGLNPYSAISLLRSSSAFFLAFLFLHKKNPIKNAAAMATIGIMTAIAILPPELKPPEPDDDPEALKADGVEVLDEVSVTESVAVPEVVSEPNVDVTTTTEGVGVVVASGVDEGVSVMVEVTSTTLGLDVVEGATKVVEGGIEVTEVMVDGGVELVSGAEDVSEEVTVTVVEKEVVKLVEVVSMVVKLTEPLLSVVESVDITARVLRWCYVKRCLILAAASGTAGDRGAAVTLNSDVREFTQAQGNHQGIESNMRTV